MKDTRALFAPLEPRELNYYRTLCMELFVEHSPLHASLIGESFSRLNKSQIW